MRVRVALCLCPNRHPVVATPIDDRQTEAEARTLVAELVTHCATVPKCIVCGALPDTWTYEVAWSRPFADEQEAQAMLKEGQLLIERLRRRKETP